MFQRKFAAQVLALLSIALFGSAAAQAGLSAGVGAVKPAATQAVLYSRDGESGQVRAVCVASLSGRPDLAPKGASAPAADFRSSLVANLRDCDSTETAAIGRVSALAGAPARTAGGIESNIKIAVAICRIMTQHGAMGGMAAREQVDPELNGGLLQNAFGIGAAAALGQINAMKYAASVPSGFGISVPLVLSSPVTFGCILPGAVLGYYGVEFLLEAPEKR